jgi:hypothetical protein
LTPIGSATALWRPGYQHFDAPLFEHLRREIRELGHVRGQDLRRGLDHDPAHPGLPAPRVVLERVVGEVLEPA